MNKAKRQPIDWIRVTRLIIVIAVYPLWFLIFFAWPQYLEATVLSLILLHVAFVLWAAAKETVIDLFSFFFEQLWESVDYKK